MAIEIVDSPIQHGDFPSFFVNVYQRVFAGQSHFETFWFTIQQKALRVVPYLPIDFPIQKLHFLVDFPVQASPRKQAAVCQERIAASRFRGVLHLFGVHLQGAKPLCGCFWMEQVVIICWNTCTVYNIYIYIIIYVCISKNMMVDDILAYQFCVSENLVLAPI